MQLAIKGGTPVRTKPFNSWPVWDELEIEVVKKAVESGNWGYPNWEHVPSFAKNFAVYNDAEYGICYNSGTSAIVGALWAAGVCPGDEVILPAYTFIATASAVMQIGAIPVFADIEPTTFHLSSRSVEEYISPITKAVLPVHLGGRMADMSRMKSVCDKHNLVLISDAAQAWGSEWQSKRAGAYGDASIYSFQSSKNITAGEGGIVLTNNEKLAEYCESYCNCGRLKDKPAYEHYYIGSNLRLSEVQGALLTAQFERYPIMLKKRHDNALALDSELRKLDGIVPLTVDTDVSSNAYHFFMIRYNKKYFENVPKYTFLEALQAEGIPAHPGYTLPLYRQPVFESGGFGPRGCRLSEFPEYGNVSLPETEKACNEEAVWLKHTMLIGTNKDIENIIEAFHKVKKNIKELN